jgi:hypothetical protein
MDGVGRCRREGWSLLVGKAEFDVRQLPNHLYYRGVGPALKALQPPATAAEALWLAYVFSFYIKATVFEAVSMLMEVVREVLEVEDARIPGVERHAAALPKQEKPKSR